MDDDDILKWLSEVEESDDLGTPPDPPNAPVIFRQVITPDMAREMLNAAAKPPPWETHTHDPNDPLGFKEFEELVDDDGFFDDDGWDDVDDTGPVYHAAGPYNANAEPPTLDEPEKLELEYETDDGAITLHQGEDGVLRLGLAKWGSCLYLSEDELEELRQMLNERKFTSEGSEEDSDEDVE